jgi:hypothetical protein
MTSQSLVFEDEILPDIEIRELLTLEQVLEENPSFVAFTRQEIIDGLNELLDNATMVDTIYEAAAQPAKNTTENVMPVLFAQRIAHDDEEYFAELEAIKRAPNYVTQQNMLNKLTYPLQHVTDDDLFVAQKRTVVGIDGETNMSTVLLPRDTLPQAIVGGVYVMPPVTKESFLHEKVAAQQDYKAMEDQPIQPYDALQPSFVHAVQRINVLTDIHGLRHHLLKYNYDLDKLTPEQLQKLIEHVRTLNVGDADADEDKDASAESTSKRRKHASFPKAALQDFYDSLKDMQRYASFNKEKYVAMYDALATTLPQQIVNVDVPIDTDKILQGLRNNSFTLQEVVNFLRMTRTKIVLDAGFATLQRYMEIDPESIPEHLEHLIRRWNHRNDKYDDRTARAFLTLYKDMTEIEKGNDTSMYDGNPMQQEEQVFEETMYEIVENDVDDETFVVAPEDEDRLPEHVLRMVYALPAGVKEVLVPCITKIAILSKAAGIQVPFDNLISYIQPHIVRISFIQILDQHVPDLAYSVRKQLSSGSYESAMRIAMGILPVTLAQQTQTVVRQMYKEHASMMKAMFVHCFAWYVLYVIEAALEKRLDFDVQHGMISCIHAWSPYGAPVTKDKEQIGVIWYLACVAEQCNVFEEFKWSTAEDLVKHTLSFISDNMADVVDRLVSKHSDIIREADQTSSKAKQANMSLAEAIQMKLKKRVLPDFVRAFLYLPGNMPSKHPVHAVGCCMQQLGEGYTADMDWEHMKKLKAVKDQLAKKRMTKVERPPLAWLERPDAASSEPMEFVTPRVRAVDEESSSIFGEWLAKCKEDGLYLLPPDIVDTLITDPTKISAAVQKHVSAFLKTAQKKSDVIETMFSSADQDVSKHIDSVAKVLHQSLQLYESETNEYTYLQTSLQHVVDFKRKLQSRPVLKHAIDLTTYQYMMRYAVTRAMCLPCDSRDVSAKTGKLSITLTVRSDFVSRTLQDVYTSMNEALRHATMPTLEEQQAFITKMREIQKVQTLQVLNSNTDEDRLMMIEAKKLGLYKQTIDYTQTADPDAEENDDDMAGEQDFAYHGEDPEVDDEQLGE